MFWYKSKGECIDIPSVYTLKDGPKEPRLLGNKGANRVIMTGLGLPVPLAFIVSIDAYKEFHKEGKLPLDEVDQGTALIEKRSAKRVP